MTKEVIKKVDEKTFYRNALIYLAANRNTPKNIFKAHFDKPMIKYCHALRVECNCVIKYSLEIEKEIKYKKKIEEEYYDIKTQKIKTRISNRDVVETVWEPYSGSYEKVCFASVIIDSEFDTKTNDKVLDYIEEKNVRSFLMKHEGSLDEDYTQEIKAVEKECLDNAKKSCRLNIKGRHYKNFEIDKSYIQEEVVDIIKIPYYKMNASLYDKQFSVCCLVDSAEHMFLMGEFNLLVSKTFKEEKEKFCKVRYLLQAILLLSLVPQSIFGVAQTIRLVNFLTSSMFGRTFNYGSLSICCLWFIVNIILYIGLEKYDKKGLNRIKTLKNKIANADFEEKKDICEKYLINEGLDLPKEVEFNRYFNMKEEDDED